MTDIKNKQLCQISDTRREKLTQTDRETRELRRRRHAQCARSSLRKQCRSIHLRNKPTHEAKPICGRNFDLEIEDPRKTLPWTDKSCQIELARDVGVVCPSPLDIIGCETFFGSKSSASRTPMSCHIAELPILKLRRIHHRGEYGLRLPGGSSEGYPANGQPRRTAEN
jgi:hypothetical protein